MSFHTSSGSSLPRRSSRSQCVHVGQRIQKERGEKRGMRDIAVGYIQWLCRTYLNLPVRSSNTSRVRYSSRQDTVRVHNI